VVALSLVVQASGFDDSFRIVALIVLPLVLFVGLATFLRLVEADIEDAWLVIGMNRVRRGYLELARRFRRGYRPRFPAPGEPAEDDGTGG
jgi:hypothetical protein